MKLALDSEKGAIVMKIFLTEMAYKWAELRQRIINLEDVRTEHMLKLLYFSSIRPECINDWCKSIANASPSMRIRTRSGVKRPSYDKLLSAMWTPIEDDCTDGEHIEAVTDNIIQAGGYPTVMLTDIAAISNYLQKFNEKLSKIMAEKEIRVNDVKQIFTDTVNTASAAFKIVV